MKNKPWLPDPSTWKGTWRDDWRIMGQEGYLRDKHLQRRSFSIDLCVEDYTQCEFCWAAFDQNSPTQLVYFEPSTKRWICEKCFNDFKDHFKWIVVDP